MNYGITVNFFIFKVIVQNTHEWNFAIIPSLIGTFVTLNESDGTA